MAIKFLFLIFLFVMYFFKPANAKAPVGSGTVRVSAKVSLTAAQISSVLTVIESSNP